MAPPSSAPAPATGGAPPGGGSAPPSSQGGRNSSARPAGAPSKQTKSKLSLRKKRRRDNNGGSSGGVGGRKKRGGMGSSSSNRRGAGGSSSGGMAAAKDPPSNDQRSTTSVSTATAETSVLDQRSEGRASVDSMASSGPVEGRAERSATENAGIDSIRSKGPVAPGGGSNKESDADGMADGIVAEGGSTSAALASAAAVAAAATTPSSEHRRKLSKRRRGGRVPIPSFSPVEPETTASSSASRRRGRPKDDDCAAADDERRGDGKNARNHSINRETSAAAPLEIGKAEATAAGGGSPGPKKGCRTDDASPEGTAGPAQSRYFNPTGDTPINNDGGDRPAAVNTSAGTEGRVPAAVVKGKAEISPKTEGRDGEGGRAGIQPAITAASPKPGVAIAAAATAGRTVATGNDDTAAAADDDSDDSSALPSPMFKTRQPAVADETISPLDDAVDGDSGKGSTRVESDPIAVPEKNAGGGGGGGSSSSAEAAPLVIDIADSDSDGENSPPAARMDDEAAGDTEERKPRAKVTDGKKDINSRRGNKSTLEKKRSAQSSKREGAGGRKAKRKREAAQTTAKCKDAMQKTMQASPDDDEFEVPRAKRLADREKTLDQGHADLIRQLSKKPSPEKDGELGDDDGDFREDVDGGGAAKKAKRTAARRSCALCSTCSCSRGSALKGLEDGAKAESANPLRGLARSDAEVERALIGRLSRLEKSASWFDNLCYKVGRELKKHRSKVKKKRADASDTPAADRPRFLADVDARCQLVQAPKLDGSRVQKAQHSMFASFDKNFQPTLTQFMHGLGRENGEDENEAEQVEGSVAETDEPAGPKSSKAQNDTIILMDDDDTVPEKALNNVDADQIDEESNYAEDETSPACRSPLADLHKALSRGQMRRANGEIFDIGIWDAATTTTCVAFYDRTVGEKSEHRFNLVGEAHMGDDQLKHSVAEGRTDRDDEWIEKVGEAATSMHENGLDHLLDLFDNPDQEKESRDATSAAATAADQDEAPANILSQLTQRGACAVDALQTLVMNNPAKLEAVEAACPNWQESIRFSFLQTDQGSVQAALENVQRSRAKLDEAKQQVAKALEQQEHVLELYEESLKESLLRFGDKPNQLECIKEETHDESSQMDAKAVEYADADDTNFSSIVEIEEEIPEHCEGPAKDVDCA